MEGPLSKLKLNRHISNIFGGSSRASRVKLHNLENPYNAAWYFTDTNNRQLEFFFWPPIVLELASKVEVVNSSKMDGRLVPT